MERKLKIDAKSGGWASLHLDDIDISNMVRGASIDLKAGHLPRVTLDVMPSAILSEAADVDVRAVLRDVPHTVRLDLMSRTQLDALISAAALALAALPAED